MYIWLVAASTDLIHNSNVAADTRTLPINAIWQVQAAPPLLPTELLAEGSQLLLIADAATYVTTHTLGTCPCPDSNVMTSQMLRTG